MIVRLLILLIFLAGLAAAGRAWELRREPLPPLLGSAAQQESALQEGALPSASTGPADLSEVRNMIERPPFAPTRRPAEAGTAEAAAAVVEAQARPELDARLLGVMRDGPERLAVLARGGANDTVIVRQGSEIDGWKVEIIQDSRVILRNGDETTEIELFVAR